MQPGIDYTDTVAFITGGTKGIGLGLAGALAERGAKLALIGTDAEGLDQATRRFDPERTIAVRLDVRDFAAWPAAVERAEAALGPINFLALNAGAQGGRRPVEEIPREEWQWVWDVNVGGIYNGLQACLPGMKRRGTSGHVLTTSSIAALLPRANASAYGASKAAALAIMESLRLEVAGTPIGASVFCPALVQTDFAKSNARHAPGAGPETFAFMRAFEGQGLEPLAVGRFVLDAIDAGAFYIFRIRNSWTGSSPASPRCRPRLRDQAACWPPVTSAQHDETDGNASEARSCRSIADRRGPTMSVTESKDQMRCGYGRAALGPNVEPQRSRYRRHVRRSWKAERGRLETTPFFHPYPFAIGILVLTSAGYPFW